MDAVNTTSVSSANDSLQQITDSLSALSTESSLSDSNASCAYCDYNEHSSLAKCEVCCKWFCNTSSSSKSSASHIVTHCVTSRHNYISVHPNSKLGDTELECYNCGSKNIFTLGFVMAKDNTVVILLCRMPCSQKKNLSWDVSNWRPLIDNKKLLSWILSDVQLPDKKTKPVSLIDLKKLEDQWRSQYSLTDSKNKKSANENIDKPEELIPPILNSYSNPSDYYSSFLKLITLEAEHDKKATEAQAVSHLNVRWSQYRNNRYCAHFILPTYEHNQLRINVGDSMVLSHKETKLNGIIVGLPNYKSEEIMLEVINLRKKSKITEYKSDFTAQFIWKDVSFKRMRIALKCFLQDKDSLSFYLFNCILGQPIPKLEIDYGELPKDLNIENFVKLNESQTYVIRNILNKSLSLIQGPPGTGKTVTSSAIIYHLLKLSKNKKILVCAPSNVAVDNLAIKLSELGIKVVRIFSKNREEIKNRADDLGLHSKVKSSASVDLKKLLKLKETLVELTSEDKDKLTNLIYKTESNILKDTQVVCTTCVGAGDHRLRNRNFPIVLIDESTQACEPEVLIPITKGAQQLILVGDHKQLGPIVFTNSASKAGLKSSLFERLIHMGHIPLRLEVQYRMNPKLSEFPSNIFYNGSLQNGVTLKDRAIQNNFPWPARNIPMMFWSQFGKEEISTSGVSYINRLEASACEKAVTKLFEEGVEPEQIGIITPYEGQRVYISQYMSMNNSSRSFASKYEFVEIQSIDAFQGREKDYIILSCVRSNDNQTIGFLHDRRRLNVALTRAKFGLIILGSPTGLSRHWVWNKLLIHFRKNDCLVEGTLDNLKPCNVHLPNLNIDNDSIKLPLVTVDTDKDLPKNDNRSVSPIDETGSEDVEDDAGANSGPKDEPKKQKSKSTKTKKKFPKEELFSISNNSYSQKHTSIANNDDIAGAYMTQPSLIQHSVSYGMPKAPSASSYNAPNFPSSNSQITGTTFFNGFGGQSAAANNGWYKGPPPPAFNTYNNGHYGTYPYFSGSNGYDNSNSSNGWWGSGW